MLLYTIAYDNFLSKLFSSSPAKETFHVPISMTKILFNVM